MPRNASAIALKLYLIAVLLPVGVRALPLPGTLQNESTAYGLFTVWLIIGGCAVAMLGVIWRDRLDGGVIEQFGLIMACLGFAMYGAVLATLFPMTWLPMTMCGGFAVAFGAQFFLIKRWRTTLRKAAAN